MAKPRTDRAAIRSERISLALTPDTFNGVKLLAAMNGISVNEFVSAMIGTVVTKNANVIAEFAAAQSKAVAAIDLSVVATDPK